MLAPSLFTSVLLFATFTSVVFGITHRSNTRDMIRYGLFCWAMFVGSVIAASWIMYFIRK